MKETIKSEKEESKKHEAGESAKVEKKEHYGMRIKKVIKKK